jgi:hypothetical protein
VNALQAPVAGSAVRVNIAAAGSHADSCRAANSRTAYQRCISQVARPVAIGVAALVVSGIADAGRTDKGGSSSSALTVQRRIRVWGIGREWRAIW